MKYSLACIVLVLRFLSHYWLHQELFKQLPHQRKLSADEEVEAAKLLSMKANKKLVQDKMAGMTGKVILLKDLSNMSGKMKARRTRNDLEAAVKLLTEKHGKCIYVYTVIPPPPPLPLFPHLHSLCRLIIL